jgi:hypothetical protein
MIIGEVLFSLTSCETVKRTTSVRAGSSLFLWGVGFSKAFGSFALPREGTWGGPIREVAVLRDPVCEPTSPNGPALR